MPTILDGSQPYGSLDFWSFRLVECRGFMTHPKKKGLTFSKGSRTTKDHEIAALKNLLPGDNDANAAGVAQSQDKMLKVEKNSENRTGVSSLTLFYSLGSTCFCNKNQDI